MIALNRSFATLYLVLVSGVIFEIAILEDQLIRVAGQRYASASALIPLLALPFSLYGLFRVLYFTSSDPRRIKWFRGLSIFGSFVFIGIACATAGRLGAYGIVIAHCAPFLFGTLVMLWLGRSGGAPFPLEVRRSALAVASGAACLLADRLVVAFTGVPRLVPDAVAAVLLPILLLATGAIPRRWPAVAVSLLRRGRGGQATRADVAARLLELDPQEVVRLFEVVDASRLETVVDRTGISRPELLTWFVATLRMLAGGGPSSPDEEALGEYLLFSGPTAARDALARRLVAAEVEPLELERLSGTLAVLRKLPRRRWRDIALEAGRRPREAGRGPRVAERLPPPRPDTAPEPGPIAVADAAEELLQDPL